jgi:hypothetical protein
LRKSELKINPDTPIAYLHAPVRRAAGALG